MRLLNQLFENNRKWAEEITQTDATFFSKLSKQQAPKYLWIGCSDSRVPANQVVGLSPGEVFVHRNVANLVVHTDLNCLSVMQYAVDVLKVEHIIVCGHYNCGGVKAAMEDLECGLIVNWLRHIQDVHHKYALALSEIEDDEARLNRFCELNVIEQVVNVCRTTVVRDAWRRGQEVGVHGWIYGLEDGILRDLGMCVAGFEDLETAYATTLQSLPTA